MLVHVTVHLDLRPEKNRPSFNDFMEAEEWSKLLVVFTTWYRPFQATDEEAACREAIRLVRKAAKSARVTFDGVVVAGNSAPVRFDMTGSETTGEVESMTEDEFMRQLVNYVMPNRSRR